MKEILYTTALDKDNNLVRIENANKGDHYFCPLCKKELIYRNSGKTGKGSRRPHFAHNELSTNCTGEGVLHYSFKHFLVDYLKNEILSKNILIMSWFCISEKHKNKLNLLERVSFVKLEYNLNECRPDIALFDCDDNLVAVIEVIVRHFPDENAVKYYEDNNIIQINIILSSEDDLNNVENKIKNPDFVNFCIYTKCTNYKTAITKRKLYMYQGFCSSLYHHQLKKCFVEIYGIFGKQRTLSLTEEEIKISKENGVDIIEVNSQGSNEKIVEFPCRRCAFERNKYMRKYRF